MDRREALKAFGLIGLAGLLPDCVTPRQKRIPQETISVDDCVTNLHQYVSDAKPVDESISGVYRQVKSALKGDKQNLLAQMNPLDRLDLKNACTNLQRNFQRYDQLASRKAKSWTGPYDPKDPEQMKAFTEFNEIQREHNALYALISSEANILSSTVARYIK